MESGIDCVFCRAMEIGLLGSRIAYALKEPYLLVYQFRYPLKSVSVPRKSVSVSTKVRFGPFRSVSVRSGPFRSVPVSRDTPLSSNNVTDLRNRECFGRGDPGLFWVLGFIHFLQ